MSDRNILEEMQKLIVNRRRHELGRNMIFYLGYKQMGRFRDATRPHVRGVQFGVVDGEWRILFAGYLVLPVQKRDHLRFV